jgi:DNA-binding PadR family transcriptional regulator
LPLFIICMVTVMSVAHVLLGVLAEGAAHGYDLKRAHDAWFPSAKPLAYGHGVETGRLC